MLVGGHDDARMISACRMMVMITAGNVAFPTAQTAKGRYNWDWQCTEHEKEEKQNALLAARRILLVNNDETPDAMIALVHGLGSFLHTQYQ